MKLALAIFLTLGACALDDEEPAPYYPSCTAVCSYFTTRFSRPTCPDPDSDICWCKLYNHEITWCSSVEDN